MPQLCDSIASSVQDGILYSEIQDTPVRRRHLHHSNDMDLVEIQFMGKHSSWLRTCWKQGPQGKLVDFDTIILTHPCIVILRFRNAPHLLGFYSSHEKKKSKKRQLNGRRINYPLDLRSIVVACPPESCHHQCWVEVRRCYLIEIVPLTTLMGDWVSGPHDFSSRVSPAFWSMDR